MSLLLHEALHLAVGVFLGALLYQRTRRAPVLLWTLTASLLIDLDHLVDYLLTVGPHWDAQAVATGSYFVESGRVVVPLHAWEVTAGLLLLGSRARSHTQVDFGLGVGAGLFGHLLIDQIWYRQPWGLYFLLLRLIHGFADPRNW